MQSLAKTKKTEAIMDMVHVQYISVQDEQELKWPPYTVRHKRTSHFKMIRKTNAAFSVLYQYTQKPSKFCFRPAGRLLLRPTVTRCH